MTGTATPDLSETIAAALRGFASGADRGIYTVFLADALVCAMGAASVADGIVARLQRMVPAGGPATLWATGERTDTETAALQNGIAIRYLDSNDTYVSKGIVHPSDMLACLVALAEERSADWERLIEAAAVSYEVMCRLADTGGMSARGFDGSTLSPIATAAGAAWLAGLDQEKTARALRIAALDAGTLRVVRQGKLSDWKAISSPRGAAKAIFALRMAEAGCLPPEVVFDSDDGFVGRISGPIDFDTGAEMRSSRIILKAFPAQVFIQGMMQLALDLRAELDGDLSGIASVTVRTFERAVALVGGQNHGGKLNRATADHSAPFCIASILVAGRLGHDDYDAMLGDDRVARLMATTSLEADPEATERYPGAFQSVMTVTLENGRTLTARQETSAGLRPDRLRKKFDELWPADGARGWRWSISGTPPDFPA